MNIEEHADYAEWVNGRDARWANLSGAKVANRFGYGQDVKVRAEMANGFDR